MLTNLSVIVPSIPKKYRVLFLLVLSPVFIFAQSLTGLWTGTISNDSNTVRKDQSFEIALTEYRGKVYGYSRSEFIVDDVLYYIVKRVKGTIEGDVCEVTDDDIISFNFPGKLDKNVKVTSTFRRDKTDSIWYLAGKWKTNTTKKFYSVSGKVDLEQEKDLTASKIFPHLEELKLADEIVFYKERKEGIPIVKIAKPEKTNSAVTNNADALSKMNDVAMTKPVVAAAQPGIVAEKQMSSSTVTTVSESNVSNKQVAQSLTENETIKVKVETKNKDVVNNTPNNTTPIINSNNSVGSGINNQSDITTANKIIENANLPVVQKAVTVTNQNETTTEKNIKATATNTPVEKPIAKQNSTRQATTEQPVEKTITKKETKPTTVPAVNNSKTEISKTAIAKNESPVTTNENNSIPTEKKESIAAPVVQTAEKTIADITSKAAVIGGRKSEFSQVVNFKSDSIILSLYDNGEIDGDTVSVYMNGEVLMANQGLKAAAIRKTIYLPAGNDEFTLVMFAESLGKYPPNTGLLVIRDGNDIYNLRFSSDFQKSSGIVFKRKK